MAHDNAGDIPMRPLGRTGVKVSALGMGGHHLGEFKTVEEAIRFVHEAVDAGITFCDNCCHAGRKCVANKSGDMFLSSHEAMLIWKALQPRTFAQSQVSI